MEGTPGKSSDKTKKWLIGCGIGCGAVALILLLLGVGGYFFVRNIVQEVKDQEELLSSLTEKHGRIKEYCPDPEGTIPAVRLEAFLSVRQVYSSVRQELEESLSTLSGAEKRESDVKPPRGIFRMLGIGFGLLPKLADYFRSRNQALLDEGMGMGEYYYIYVVAYYSWLRKSPEDGPPFPLMDEDRGEDFRDWDEEDIREMRRDNALRKLHRMTLPMLHNQYAQLTESQPTADQKEWQEALAAEIEAMEADRFRLPWQDGLPDTIEASLRPFRDRLKASYSPITNPLEIAIEQR